MMKTQYLMIAAAFAAGCSQQFRDLRDDEASSPRQSAPDVATTPQSSQYATEGENVTEAHPLAVNVTQKGGLSFPGGYIDFAAYRPGWTGIPAKVDWQSAETGEHVFEIRENDGPVLFRGRGSWSEGTGGALDGTIEIECLAETEMQCLAVTASVPEEPPFGVGDGTAAVFELPALDGRVLRLEFPGPVPYHSQDSRQWGGRWSVRFGEALGRRVFKPGDRLTWKMAVSSPDGIAMTASKPVTVARGDDWVPLDYRKDPAPGSALDFSGMGFQDAPAGKHGWLRAAGGRFEFEGLPGAEQRFYGVNLCFSANYPDHEMADRLVERFAMCGYNSIRVHHHDGAWAAAHASRKVEQLKSRKVQQQSDSDLQPSTFQPFNQEVDFIDDDIDRLDYLLARCFERGIYVTTDLYVSRPVTWREIGIDRDGNMEKQLYKTYIGLHDGAFGNWCDNAREFLEHVNPYIGRAMKDEPGIPLISLVNEGKLHMGWGRAGKAKDPVVKAAWREFQREMSTNVHKSSLSTNANENFDLQSMDNGEQLEFVDNAPVPGPGSQDYSDLHHQFDEWVNRRVWERCSAFVRSLGCRALLTNDNNGRWHGEGEGLTPLYDYVDSHFYVDHPTFLEQQWKLPSRCSNENPIRNELPAILHRGYAKGSSKPYAITEWNFSGPGRYRAMGGILTGALAAEQDWDGLWRFAYSHNKDNFADGKGGPGYFDCVTDPLIAASDRASVCLFLGNSCKESPGKVERLKVEKLKGSCSAPATKGAARRDGGLESASPLVLDKARGTMVLDTPFVCGGFAESGRIDAGPLSFIIQSPMQGVRGAASPTPVGAATAAPVPATLWVTSLDGAPVAESSRMLLVHLTDVQGEGAQYADSSRRVILKWGKTPLVEAGAAAVELRLRGSFAAPAPSGGAAESAAPAVWELDTAGERVAELPSEFDAAGGVLRFQVSTRAADGSGRIFYEIVRPAAAPGA